MEPAPNLATLMEAIKSSELLQSEMDSSIASLASELHKKTDSLSVDLCKEISVVRSDLTKCVEVVRRETTAHTAKIRTLEEGAKNDSDYIITLAKQVMTPTSQVCQLVNKTVDLESRQHRDNCTIAGVQ